jgi:leucyl/phenylalanyl-tRNA--protein transferase
MHFLDHQLSFPDPRKARRGGAWDGLVAVGGDFSVPRLLLAYRSGLFPWTVDPITWWSPDPRAILELDAFHVSRSLRRWLRKNPLEVTRDGAFREVMAGCAEPRPGRGQTWITTEFLEGYGLLHEAGHAHSLECWEQGRLVGGIYGVAIGGFFAGESMFHRVSNASKVALFHLVEHLKARGFVLFDLQMITPVAAQLGATQIPREEYLRRLKDAVEARCDF